MNKNQDLFYPPFEARMNQNSSMSYAYVAQVFNA